MDRWSLAVVNSHPIQYFVPLYRRLAQEEDLDLTVYFCSRAGVDRFPDPGFDQAIQWDVPLLDGYESVFLENRRDVDGPGGFWSLVNPGVVRAIRREGHDAVWLHGHNYATNILAAAAATLSGTSLFMRCETHLGLRRPTWKRALRRPVMSAFYSFFDACLAIGSRNARFYRAHGVADEEIFLVPYTVDNRRFRRGADLGNEERRAVRAELGLPEPGVPVVLYLSKLTPRKRPLDLLEAFRSARERAGTDAALAYVGAGPQRSRLEARARKMDGVHFLGFRNQTELPRIYGACDVFVLPSENEPWGLVVNEAMASGLPVVVSDEVGAAADLVEEGNNGHVYPCGDVGALAGHLGRLISAPDVRERMANGSQRIIGEWDYDRCVQGVRRALGHVAGRRE